MIAERTKGRYATDRRHGAARDSPRNYYTHHLQQISKAAVMYDAMAIRKALLHLAPHSSPIGPQTRDTHRIA